MALRSLAIQVRGDEDDRVLVSLDDTQLSFSGTKLALNKIGDSLLNFFDENSVQDDHFHLDYYEENQILRKTNCHLIFVCEGQMYAQSRT